MKHRRLHLEVLESRCVLSADPIISEFLASNGRTLQDEDGDFSDWIELFNRGSEPIDLAGWHLTDNASNLTKWEFPAVELRPSEYLVVFASSKDRSAPGSQLHTNFALSKEGEFLALVQPDGVTIASQFAPEFPVQFDDVSYGWGSAELSSTVLVGAGTPASVHVPTSNVLGSDWTSPSFLPDATWHEGTFAVGYQQDADQEPSNIILQVDFNDRDSPGYTQAGFSPFVLDAGPETQTSAVTRTFGSIEVTVSDASGGLGYQDRFRNGAPANSGSFTESHLLTDFIFSNDDSGSSGLDVTVSGLVPGSVYTLTGWSYDQSSGGSDRVSDWAANGVLAVENYSFRGGNAPTSNDVYQFAVVVEANALGEIVLQGRRDEELSSNYAVFLNALQVETGDTLNLGLNHLLRLDLDDRTEGESGSANSENGYSQMTLDENGATFGNLKVTFLPFNGGALDDRDRSGPLDQGDFTLGQVYDDHILSSGPAGSGLEVLIEGLAPGIEYEVLLRSFDADAGGPRSSIWTEESGAASVPIASPYVFDGNIAPANNDANTMRATLVASPNGTLLIRGVQADANRSVALAGLEIARASLTDHIGLDIEAEMAGENSSAFIRAPFSVAQLDDVDQLLLDMRYDAGFVAYLNGHEVARRNAPSVVGVPPEYDAAATIERTTPETLGVETIDLTGYRHLLHEGDGNILAFHGLNSAANDSDFLILPELRAIKTDEPSLGYFLDPTPNGVNGAGVVGFVDTVQLSVPPGLHVDPQVVEMSTTTPGASIYYTTDGSLPVPTNSSAVLYSGGIAIDSTAFLRASAVKEGFGNSPVIAATYIYIEDVLVQDPQNAIGGPQYPFFWQGNASGDYAIDPRVVAAWDDFNPQNQDFGIREALTSLPTMSIVMDHDDLWNATTGIYPNATSEGSSWRRAGSIEYFDPATGESFQHNVGVQMHGAASRDNGRLKKHSFRLIFNPDFGGGPGRLDFPIFDNTDFADINTVVLRASFTDSFATRTITDRYSPLDSTYTRDVFMRDTQLAMGHYAPHSTYVHLYINGLYWGLYSPAERTDDASLAGHLGGEREDWDVIKDFNQLFRGNRDVYDEMFAIGNQIAAASSSQANALFQTLQGNLSDGTPDPDGVAYLDVDNFIDYMILHLYAGVEDWPSHNWVAARNRVDPGKGFQFFTWDQEIALDGRFRDRTEASNAFSPAELFVDLRKSSEFRLRFADRVQKHMFDEGALTTEANTERWMQRADQIEAAIIGESARWGDAREGEVVNVPPQAIVPLMTVEHWRASIAQVVGYFPLSHDLAISRFTHDGLFPVVEAPQFSQYGGMVTPGSEFTMNSPSGGTIWYTLNGEDPRLIGGSVNAAAAAQYNGPLTIDQSVTVKARSLVGGEWSPLVEATLATTTGYQGIVISEFNYHPSDPTPAEAIAVPGVEKDDFEFIEVLNTHPTQTISLLGMSLANGLSFTFGNVSLAPGQRGVIVEDIASFQARYGTSAPILGEWSGGLSNSGETIELRDGVGNVVMAVSYLDENPWSEAPDGDGATLELIDPFDTPGEALGKWYSWRASTEFGGSPGSAGIGPIGVVINEVLAHTSSPQVDAIELHNTTDLPINLGGWFLSDSGGNSLKYEIPADTWLAPGGFVVFDESHFNPVSPSPGQQTFALNAWEGDDVFLVIPNGQGGVLALVDSVHFGASFNGQTWGRVDDTGRLAPLNRNSLGYANGQAAVGPLVISEVMYSPTVPTPAALALDPSLTASHLGYIELHNPTTQTIDLTNYRVSGDVAFSFVAGSTIAPGATMLVVPFNPQLQASRAEAFRAHYGIAAQVSLVGPFVGSLSELGTRIALQAPDVPSPNAPGTIPRVAVDEIHYDNLDPWPAAPAALGLAIHRVTPTAYGNDGGAWRSEAPSPGSVNYHAAVMGDFNGDGIVALDDLELLADAIEFQSTVAYFDLNGDGFIDPADIAYLVNSIVAPIAGDFNWDGMVDQNDYAVWKANFGAMNRGLGDANLDGVVDAADYTIWRNNLGASGGGAEEGPGAPVALFLSNDQLKAESDPGPTPAATGLLNLTVGVRSITSNSADRMWRAWSGPAILEREPVALWASRAPLPESGATVPVDRKELLLLADVALEQFINESDPSERHWYRFDEKEEPSEVIEQWAVEHLFADWP